MKLAHFIDTRTTGGAEKLVIDLAEAAKAAEHEVVILHFGHPWLPAKARELGIDTKIVPDEAYYKSIKTLHKFSRKFREFLQQEKIELLHSHLFGPSIAGGLACSFTRIRHICTLHDSYILEEKPARVGLLKLVSLLGTRIVCVSKSIQGYINSVVRTKTTVLYNGTDIGPLPERDFGSGLKVICVGRLTEIKNHQLLINTWKNYRLGELAKLLIVGEGELEQQLKEMATDDTSIVFTGFRNDIPELLKTSHLFTLVSKSEGLSCSITEALATGLPCVVTDVGGNSELITNGANGYLVNNSSELGEKLRTLLSAPKELESLGEEAYRVAQKLFDKKAMINNYFEIYKSL